MRQIKTTVSILEQRIINEECAKATWEHQLNLTKAREYQLAANSGKNGGMA